MSNWDTLPTYLESRIVSEISTKAKIQAWKPKKLIPTEHDEQVALINWCDTYRIKIFAIPNGSNKSKYSASNFKKEGLRSGVPDLFLPTPTESYHGMFIELKRIKQSNTSQEQLDWLDYLNKQGYYAIIAYGFDQAKDEIIKYLGGKK